MRTKTLVIISIILITLSLGFFYVGDLGSSFDNAGLSAPSESTVTDSEHGDRNPDSSQVTFSPNRTQITEIPVARESVNFAVSMPLKESLIRLRLGQSEEALNELNALLDNFENLESHEQLAVVVGFANYFLTQQELGIVIDLYDQALGIPGLNTEQLRVIYRTLGQLSLNQNRIDQGIVYFEGYFSNKGEMNSLISITLSRALYSQGQTAEAADFLEEHINLLQQEGFEPGTERFPLRELRNLVLLMEDELSAIKLGNNLVDQFGTAQDYENLAALYRRLGQSTEWESLRATAIELGYIDENGNWISED